MRTWFKFHYHLCILKKTEPIVPFLYFHDIFIPNFLKIKNKKTRNLKPGNLETRKWLEKTPKGQVNPWCAWRSTTSLTVQHEQIENYILH